MDLGAWVQKQNVKIFFSRPQITEPRAPGPPKAPGPPTVVGGVAPSARPWLLLLLLFMMMISSTVLAAGGRLARCVQESLRSYVHQAERSQNGFGRHEILSLHHSKRVSCGYPIRL